MGAQVQGTTLKLRWDRPSVASGALSYTVGCNNSASGGTWDDTCHTVSASSNASFTASVTNKGSVQRVRVKATQSSVDGAWTTVNVPNGVPGAISGLGAQLPDGGTTLKLRWDKPSGSTIALDYAVECNDSASGNTGWTSCHTVSASSNASFTASLSGQGSVKRVRVRAERDGLQGAWTTGAVPSGLPAAPSSLSLTKQGTTSKATVGKPSGVTGAVTYRVHCSTDNGATWTACNVTSSSSDASHELLLPSSATNANAVRARVERDGLVSDWLAYPVLLSASSVTTTTATLTIGNYSGDWYVKKTAPTPAGTCSSAISGTTHALSNLTAGTSYTYKAYSDSGCATEIASETFTAAVTVSNLSKSNATTHTLSSTVAWAQEFTTGSNAGGYTLSSVTLSFDQVINAGSITVTLRARLSNGKPNTTTALATLSGTPAVGDSTFTCSGAGCALEADTQYFVQIWASTGSQQAALVNTTSDDNETLQPSANGWGIANSVNYSGNSWDPIADRSLKLRVTAVPE